MLNYLSVEGWLVVAVALLVLASIATFGILLRIIFCSKRTSGLLDGVKKSVKGLIANCALRIKNIKGVKYGTEELEEYLKDEK